MNTTLGFPNECKFAFLGLTNARVDIPATGITLPNGTEVVTKFPIELNSQWQSWLGVEASQVSSANLVLARRAGDGFLAANLPISDDTSWDLAKRIENVFSMLRLLGTIEYESAFLIMGYVQNGRTVCQHFSKFGHYEITRGCLPWLIREEHLATAASLAHLKSDRGRDASLPGTPRADPDGRSLAHPVLILDTGEKARIRIGMEHPRVW